MNQHKIPQLQDINPHIICSLCNGYYIDATTIIVCLHTFCRACIVEFLKSNKFCPICDVQVHHVNPFLNIRKDDTIQALVYKLVPGLYQKEMQLRQKFTKWHPQAESSSILGASDLCIYSPDECFSITLEHYDPNTAVECNPSGNTGDTVDGKATTRTETPTKTPTEQGKRYLRCPAAVTVRHMHKLIRAKHGLDPSHSVDLLFNNEVLSDHLTLMDVAYIFNYKREGQFCLSYRIYANRYKRMKLDASSTQGESYRSWPTESCLVEGEGTIKNEPTNKNNDWQEVQLQISETGIMSVSGISTPNKNIFDNQSDCRDKNHARQLVPVGGLPKYLTLVDSYCDKKDLKHETPTSSKLNLTLCNDAMGQDGLLPGSSSQPASNFVENTTSSMLSNQVSVNAGRKEKKINLKGKPSKSNIQRVREPVNNMKITNACTSSYQTDVQNAKRPKLADRKILPKEVTKAASEYHISKDASKSNDAFFTPDGTKKEPLLHQPFSSTSNMPQKPYQNVPGKNCDAKTMYPTSYFGASSMVKATKKEVSQGTVSYNTHKDSPKNWNPTFTKASYAIGKAKPSLPVSTINNNAEKKSEKAPKFFKMRNMPRYLGNPASGVKPMYQLSDNSKTPEAEPSSRSKSVVMKIDPKTLSPISCATTSEGLASAIDGRSKADDKSSNAFCSQKSAMESMNCETSVTTSELASLKKLASEKTKSSAGNEVSSSNVVAMNTSPALTDSKSSLTSASALSFKMSHAQSISATAPSSLHHEFCNDAPLQRPLGGSISETASTTSTSAGIKFSNMPNFSLNPATLNLLSSNLSFLPSASNFLYNNFSDFGPPLVRPGLSRSGCLGVITSSTTGGTNSAVSSTCVTGTGMGAFHAMPPSINMLFPHHRSTERDRSGSAHGQVHTPAVQRIPASKGTTPMGSHKQSMGKKLLLTGDKPIQTHTANGSKNIKNDVGNELVSASGTISDMGTPPKAHKTDKQATNLNNNSILGIDNAKKLEDKTLPVIDDESLMQKDVLMPNGETDSSCVPSSETQYGSGIVAQMELQANEDAKIVSKEQQMPFTDLSVKIKTGDRHRNLNENTGDNNNKERFPSICLESSSPVIMPPVISKPCTDPK